MAVNDVSPELALVDDVLAARERAQLPEPGDCLAPRPAAPAAPPPAVQPRPLPTDALGEPAGHEPEPVEVGGGELVALVETGPEGVPAFAPPVVEAEDVVTEAEAIDRAAGARFAGLIEPAALVEPAAEPEPATEPERAPEVEPRRADVEEAPAEPVGPGRMPDWVASDVPPKNRRMRRQDRARERRDGRRDAKRPMRRRVAVAASWVVLCGFLASPLLAFIPSPSGERPTLEPDGRASVPDAGGAAGHVLSWDPVAKAAGYSVVFVNDGVRSDRWSQTARLRLPAGTEAEQLLTYEWFVYPAFRDGAGYRYGPLVASGEVTMPRLAPTESS